MIIKFKAGFVVIAVLTLLSWPLSVPMGYGQGAATASPTVDSAVDKAAAEKAAAEKAAAEKAEAAKVAAIPLLVAGVEPYVVEDDKGILGDPNKLGRAGMGDRISVVIPGLFQAAKYKVIDPSKLVLFLNGRVFKEVYPESVGWNNVVYKLERTTASTGAWNDLLGSPRLDSLKPVVVSVGYADQLPLNLAEAYGEKPNLNLIVYRKGWALLSLIAFIVIFLLFWKYGRKELLRDSGPPFPKDGKPRPYSLAKVQVAWWFCLVVGSFLLIYMITGQFTMTEQTLILMGIGTGTALGAALIDESKRSNADSELDTLKPEKSKLLIETEELKETVASLTEANPGNSTSTTADKDVLKANKIELAVKQAKLETTLRRIAEAESGLENPVTAGFSKDLMTDANGISLHRFQMVVWTVVLGILFLAGVYKDLAMPQFDGTMLALMGISAGTYLGFKVPERQNPKDPERQKQKDDKPS